MDSAQDTLIPVIDTMAHAVTGIVLNWHDSTAEAFLNDSALPARVVTGKYEVFFANYTDTSVDVVITDTAGDIGVQTNLNVREQLSELSVHSNKISRAFQTKYVTPQDELPPWLDELKIGSDVFGFVKCTLPLLATIGLFTGQPELVIPNIEWGPSSPDELSDCGNQFLDAIDNLTQSGSITSQIKNYIENLSPIHLYWSQAQFEDQQIQNKPGSVNWTASESPNGGCVSPSGSCSGSCTMPDRPVDGEFQCRSDNGNFTVDGEYNTNIYGIPGPSKCNYEIETAPKWVAVQYQLPGGGFTGGIYGTFSTTQNVTSSLSVSISGSYHYRQ